MAEGLDFQLIGAGALVVLAVLIFLATIRYEVRRAYDAFLRFRDRPTQADRDRFSDTPIIRDSRFYRLGQMLSLLVLCGVLAFAFWTKI